MTITQTSLTPPHNQLLFLHQNVVKPQRQGIHLHTHDDTMGSLDAKQLRLMLRRMLLRFHRERRM